MSEKRMTMKNTLIKYCVQALAPSQRKSHSARHFLILSTTGLGDTLWATPAIRALRQSFPSSSIDVLTSAIGHEVLFHNRHIDTFFVAKDPVLFSLPRLYLRLKCRSITDVLVFHTSQRPILPLAAVLGAERIIGTKQINKGLDFLLTDPLENTSIHEIKRRLEIVQKAGALPLEDPYLELPISPQEEQQAEQFLSGFKPPFISIHPGAKDLFKQWPVSQFIQLASRLKKELNCHLFITGSPSERALVNQIAAEVSDATAVTHLRLRPFAAFLKRMQLMITNDTGPMHVAFAMGTPTVCLFTPTDPKLCGPYLVKNGYVLAQKPTCTPCLKKKCAEPFCLLQISVQAVYDSALQLFGKGAFKP